MNANNTLQVSPVPAAGGAGGVPTKWLWSAIGVLGVAVVALGGTMAVQSSRQNAQPAATVAQADPASQINPSAPVPVNALAAQQPAQPAQPQPLQPQRVAQAQPVQQGHAPQPPQYTQPVADARQAPACGVCGRVESVQAVQQAAPPTGVGAVAGGVLGAVVGNQFGHGNGRVATTVLGAAGGGYVGHQIEKNVRTHTVYQINVRMDNGTLRHFTRSQPVAEGTPIRLQGKGFRVANEPAAQYSPQQQHTTAAPEPVRVSNTY